MRVRALVAAAGAALLGLSLAACGSSGNPGSGGASGTGGSKKIVVGIKYDQPGLGMKKPDGTFSGFDVDVARYVAHQLGYSDGQITFKEVKSADRENYLQNGVVDIVVATYSITDTRQEKVDFAGPYYVAHQDLLVRADDTSITGPHTLQGKKLCSVKGSTSAQTVQDKFASKVQLQQYGSYSDCIPALLSKAIDAVTTDDVILQGYAAQHAGELKVVGQGFTDEKYGIGVKKGSDLKAKIDTAIKQMETSGSWKTALVENLKLTDAQVPTPPAIQ
jgi:glutamate transport system substrate-binding protein